MSRWRTGARYAVRGLMGGFAFLTLVLLVAAVRGGAADYPVVAAVAATPVVSRGAYHVHSSASDGWGTAEEIALAAERAGLQFVVITDHNVPPPPPRYQGKVLLVFGTEISTRAGHLVVLGSEPAPRGSSGAEAVERSLQGFAALAHPVQQKNPWRDAAAAQKVTGFELYSADTFLRDALRSPISRLLPAVGGWVGQGVHGSLLLVTPQPAPMERMLALAATHPVTALCAHDAHGYPPYEHVFGAMAMQLPEALPADPKAAATAIFEALSKGTAHCVFRGLGDASGLGIEGLSAERTAPRGAELKLTHPALQHEKVQVRVFGAGELLPDGRTVKVTGEGALQIELWVLAPGRLLGEEWRPWIVPSPIRVLPRL